jgi:hypothetical protein
MFLGKNSVAQIALGRTPEEEYKDNLRHVAKVCTTDSGLDIDTRLPFLAVHSSCYTAMSGFFSRVASTKKLSSKSSFFYFVAYTGLIYDDAQIFQELSK